MKFKIEIPDKYVALFAVEKENQYVDFPLNKMVFYFLSVINCKKLIDGCTLCKDKSFKGCGNCIELKENYEIFTIPVFNEEFYRYVIKIDESVVPTELKHKYVNGVYFDVNLSTIVGLLLLSQYDNKHYSIHANFPLQLIQFEVTPYYSQFYKLKDKKTIVPKWRVDVVDESTAIGDAYVSENTFTVCPITYEKEKKQAVLQLKNSYLYTLRQRAYKYISVNNLNKYVGYEITNPSSNNKRFYCDLPFENVLHWFSIHQHLQLPVKVFTISENYCIFAVMYRHQEPWRYTSELEIKNIQFESLPLEKQANVLYTVPVDILQRFNLKLDFNILIGYKTF